MTNISYTGRNVMKEHANNINQFKVGLDKLRNIAESSWNATGDIVGVKVVHSFSNGSPSRSNCSVQFNKTHFDSAGNSYSSQLSKLPKDFEHITGEYDHQWLNSIILTTIMEVLESRKRTTDMFKDIPLDSESNRILAKFSLCGPTVEEYNFFRKALRATQLTRILDVIWDTVFERNLKRLGITEGVISSATICGEGVISVTVTLV